MTVGSTGAYVAEYIWREDDRPCFRCSRCGHKQTKCQRAARCGFCSGEHWTKNCTNRDQAKCSVCSGEHPIWSRKCVIHPRSTSTAGTSNPAPKSRVPTPIRRSPSQTLSRAPTDTTPTLTVDFSSSNQSSTARVQIWSSASTARSL